MSSGLPRNPTRPTTLADAHGGAPIPNALSFRVLRLLADGEFHSGEELARQLKVTRTTVWKALQGLETWGVTLFKVNGRGYRLVTPIDWLDAQAVRAHLGARANAFQVEIVDAIGSTNTVLLNEALAGAPAGLVVAAELQTHGRGRRGRTWHTGLGGALTFSLLWRFELGVGALGGLSLAASVALLRTMRDLDLQDVAVKWPNDLLWRHQKLAGILTEIEGDVSGPSAAVIGIGINVRVPDPVKDRIDQAVTDLSATGVEVTRSELLGRLLKHLAEVLDAFGTQGFGALRDEWDAAHALRGRTVAVSASGQPDETGVVAGVAEDGALLLRAGSAVRRYYSGEISVRPGEALRRA